MDRITRKSVQTEAQAVRKVKKAYSHGNQHLRYIPAKELIGTEGEATVDGTHATNLGFRRMAEAMEPTLRAALKNRH